MFTSPREVRLADAVQTVMMWPVAVTPCGATMRQVAESLSADEVGILVVVANGHLVGVVSERDVVRHLADGANPDHVLVEDIMTTELLEVKPETPIAEAARLMVEAGVRHLPVLDGDAVAGIVSARDVLALLARATV
jgi:CBS domain-containing protein